MKPINTCCGSYTRKRTPEVRTPVPPNPKVQGGVAVIYLGSGAASFKGAGTGAVYHASDHSRHFKVFSEDAAAILRKPDVILKP